MRCAQFYCDAECSNAIKGEIRARIADALGKGDGGGRHCAIVSRARQSEPYADDCSLKVHTRVLRARATRAVQKRAAKVADRENFVGTAEGAAVELSLRMIREKFNAVGGPTF